MGGVTATVRSRASGEDRSTRDAVPTTDALINVSRRSSSFSSFSSLADAVGSSTYASASMRKNFATAVVAAREKGGRTASTPRRIRQEDGTGAPAGGRAALFPRQFLKTTMMSGGSKPLDTHKKVIGLGDTLNRSASRVIGPRNDEVRLHPPPISTGTEKRKKHKNNVNGYSATWTAGDGGGRGFQAEATILGNGQRKAVPVVKTPGSMAMHMKKQSVNGGAPGMVFKPQSRSRERQSTDDVHEEAMELIRTAYQREERFKENNPNDTSLLAPPISLSRRLSRLTSNSPGRESHNSQGQGAAAYPHQSPNTTTTSSTALMMGHNPDGYAAQALKKGLVGSLCPPSNCRSASRVAAAGSIMSPMLHMRDNQSTRWRKHPHSGQGASFGSAVTSSDDGWCHSTTYVKRRSSSPGSGITVTASDNNNNNNNNNNKSILAGFKTRSHAPGKASIY